MSDKRRGRRLALLLTLATGAGLLVAVPASAASLTNVQWSVSNNQIGATNVRYTFQFTTAVTGTIKKITMTVPPGTAGTPAVAANYGISAGTVVLAADALTYTVTSATSVSAGIPILIELSGLTNTAAVGTYWSDITTKDATDATIDGPTASTTVDIAEKNTAVELVLAKSLTFTNDTPAFTLLMDPALAALADHTKTVNLTVRTNASNGYTVTAKDDASGLVSRGDTIARFTSNGQVGANAWDTEVNAFGYRLAVTGATLPAKMRTGNYAGYVSAGETIASRTGPTSDTADTIAVSNRVKINYGQDAGGYADTIVYTATPSY